MRKLVYVLLSIILFLNIAVGDREKVDDGVIMIVKGNTEFAFDLYSQLKNNEGNLFYSPYSISTALAMTYAGAKDQTAEQMVHVLHFPECKDSDSPGWMRTTEQFHRAFGRVIDRLNQQGLKGNYQLSIANALWGQKDYPFVNSFTELNKIHYKAGLENLDFTNETEKSRIKINRWVEDKTNEKIMNLIPKGALDTMTRLVLTNAIYFKGDWASQFDAAATSEQDFYITSDKIIKAPLMYQKEKFKYTENDMLQMLELPYKGDDLSMQVLLPKAKNGLADLEDQLIAENLSKWQKQLHKQKVEVYLPKFKMTSQFSLNETLKIMGMTDAFDTLKADFSGMTGSKDLFISAVLHKAFVEVNEEGTEAAAATGAIMALTSVPAPPPVFRADYPFVFIIKDNNTSSILFIGRVTDPTKTRE